MKTLEIKEINLSPADFYNYQAYRSRGDGLYLVNDVSTVDDFTTLVFVKNNCTIYIGDGRDFNFIESKEKLNIEANPKSNGLVSEELFLKAMSLIVNKDESYKN